MLMEGKPENSEGTLTVEALTKLVFGEMCLRTRSRGSPASL